MTRDLLPRRSAGLAAACACVLAAAGASAAAQLPPLPPAQQVEQRPVVEMQPPGVRRPLRGFSLADPATTPRREPPPPAGGIDFGELGRFPRALQLDPADPPPRR